MSKNITWIKLYRNLKNWHWYKNINTKVLYIHLLLECNYLDYKFENIIIKRGQLVTGRKQLALDTGLSEQQVRTALKNLKSTNDITTSPRSKYTIVTLVNYDKYQNSNLNEQPPTNQQLTNDQPQLKKEKKEINISTTTTKLETNLNLINSIAKELNKSNDIIISKIPDFVTFCSDNKKIHNGDADLYSHFRYWIQKRKFNTDVDENKVNWFMKTFNTICKGNFKVTDEVKKLFEKQLSNGFTGEQMRTACKNMYSSDPKNKFHLNSGYQHATPTHLLKDDNVNKYLNQRF